MAQIKSGTLVAATVASVTLAGQVGKLAIINRDASTEFFFSLNGVDPTVGGDDCGVVLAKERVQLLARGPLVSGNTVVKLISSGTPAYTVAAVDS